jgi:hypothetical protein
MSGAGAAAGMGIIPHCAIVILRLVARPGLSMNRTRVDGRSEFRAGKALLRIALLAAAAVLAVLWWPSHDSRGRRVSFGMAGRQGDLPSIESEDRPSQAVLKIDALRLYENLAANDPSTVQMIGQMGVELKGMIGSIGTDEKNNVVIYLLSGDQHHPSAMTLRHRDPSQVSRLSEGQTITMRCNHVVREQGAPHGYGCAIVAQQALDGQRNEPPVERTSFAVS